MSPQLSLKHRLYRQFEPHEWPRQSLSPLNRAIMIAIVLAVLVAVAETERTLSAAWGQVFLAADIILTLLFTVEYLTRLWVAGIDQRYRGFAGRLRWMVTPWAIIDLLAILPGYLLLTGIQETVLLRLLRIARILRVARLGAFSEALDDLGAALASRRFEFLVVMLLAGGVLFFAATGLYLLEGRSQPDAFGSIPRALWWAVITLTTVGYGDIVPMTFLGRLFGAMVALSGIAVIAMPTAVLGAAITDMLRTRSQRRERRKHHRDDGTASDEDR